MRTSISIFTIAIIFAMPVEAAEYMVMGAGTATCGQYAEAYKKSPPNTEIAFMSWVGGFLSGMNMSAYLKGQPLKNLGTPEEEKQHLHSYCDAHPLNDLVQATLDVYQSLPILNPQNLLSPMNRSHN
jgi:hypothetical protein